MARGVTILFSRVYRYLKLRPRLHETGRTGRFLFGHSDIYNRCLYETGTKNRSDRSEVIPLAEPNRLSSDRDELGAGWMQTQIHSRPISVVFLASEQY